MDIKLNLVTFVGFLVLKVESNAYKKAAEKLLGNTLSTFFIIVLSTPNLNKTLMFLSMI